MNLEEHQAAEREAGEKLFDAHSNAAAQPLQRNANQAIGAYINSLDRRNIWLAWRDEWFPNRGAPGDKYSTSVSPWSSHSHERIWVFRA